MRGAIDGKAGGAMTEDWISKLAEAHRRGDRFAPTMACPESLEQVYQIQSGVSHQMGAVAGFKLGLKSGQAPIMAPIFAAGVMASGAQVDVSDVMGIELEVGLRILADLPANIAKASLGELAAYLQPVAVIELVGTRITGPFAQDPFVKLADNQINAGLVVGGLAEAWDGDDISVVIAKFRAGPDQILDGAATVPGGSALASFAALVRHIGDHCGGLCKGQIVITGSLHPLVYYPKGTEVTGEIAGIGSVQVTLG
ncbi:MAG: 2-keto-4-pentenoate hydratase [Pseudorhodobacter sp.]|jgi:2-keto-4-pentenoate hydratase